MKIQNVVVVVTGAGRGLGRELVRAFAQAGARKVYAAGRDPAALAATAALAPGQVVPLALDVSDRASIAAAARLAPDATLLVNNAGVLDFGSVLDAPPEVFERNLQVNLFGPLLLTRALAPAISANGGGAVVNVMSVVALASMPGLAAYNASKAALHSATQSLRASLRPQGVSVHGVYPGPIDTDMAKDIPFDKTSSQDVARAIVAGVEDGREDIFPDAMSAQVGAQWFQNPKAVEQQFAAM